MSNVGGDIVNISTAQDPATQSATDIPIIGDLLFDPILDGVNGVIDQGIQDLQGQIVGDLKDNTGIRDVYLFYTGKICEGTLEDGEAAETGASNGDGGNSPREEGGLDIGKVKIEDCFGYDDENKGMRLAGPRPPPFHCAQLPPVFPLPFLCYPRIVPFSSSFLLSRR